MRTSDQLAKIKNLIIQQCDDWAKESNVIITADHSGVTGMGLVYLTVANDGGNILPYGDGQLFHSWSLSVGVHYNLNVDQQNKYSKLTTTITDYAEKVINALHMVEDSLWYEPIKFQSYSAVDIDKNTNWATVKLKFTVVQVEYFPNLR